MPKYVRVMDGTKSNAGGFEYKLDQINISTNWNPNETDPEKMGGFNFGSEDKILRWLHRGDTLYDVIIPEDAEVVLCNEEKGIWRANKIIVTNPRTITDEVVMELYKKTTLSNKILAQCLQTLLWKNRLEISKYIIKDRVNKENVNEFIKEFKNYNKKCEKFNYEELGEDSKTIYNMLNEIRGNNMFPKEIQEIVKNTKYTIDDVGRSEDQVYIFEDKYILKISKDKTRLIDEKERIDFLSKCNIPCSKSICYLEESGKCYYLRTYIKGYNLIHSKFKENPELLVDVLVNIIKILRSLDNCNCPFKSKDNIGNDFVHGDLCLPNIYVDENNNFAGFIDLDNSGLGDKWYDYSWLLWSLEYNLKTDKYNKILLDKLQISYNQEKYEKYIPEKYRKKQ